jgi:hypothetical protein
MSPLEAKKLKRAIRQLVLAEIADSWKGGGYPEDIPIIEEELRRARIRVSVIIAQNTEPAGLRTQSSNRNSQH